jgi:hypothetical protein
MSRLRRWLAGGAVASAVALAQRPGDTVTIAVETPMFCQRGPDARFSARVTLPASAATGSQVGVRIDSVPSGRIDHLGLFFIHDMTTDYLVPVGTRYVEGSARVVPETGTANVQADARAWADDAGIHLALPVRIENGSSYTPPSLEFAVTVEAPEGALVPLQFDRSSVAADAFLVGTLVTRCEPRPRPFTLATLRVEGPAAADGGSGR